MKKSHDGSCRLIATSRRLAEGATEYPEMVARGMPTFARTGRERLRHHIMETFGFSVSRERTGFVAASPRRSADQRHQGERTLRSRVVGLLQSEDIANAIVYAVTQPLRVSVNEILIRPTQQPV